MFCNNCGATLQPHNQFCPTCGVPVTQRAAPPPPPPPSYQGNASPPSSWTAQPGMNGMPPPPQKSSSGCGKILLILGILGILVLAGFGGLAYLGYRKAETALKSSDAYKLALSTLKASPEAKEKLGEIKDTGFPLGSFNEEMGGTGNAAFTMSVTGTKANGRYNVVMRRSHSVWNIVKGFVTLESGETVNIVNTEYDDDSTQNSNTDDDATLSNANIKPERGTIAGGILDSKVIIKPEPTYPQTARAVHASGKVTVQVVVDESGKVTSAQALSGHPLLQSAAVAAAKNARFAPILSNGKPVKVTGLLTYNFVAQ